MPSRRSAPPPAPPASKQVRNDLKRLATLAKPAPKAPPKKGKS